MSPLESTSHHDRTVRPVRSATEAGGATPVPADDVQAQLAALTLLCETLLGDPDLPVALHPLGNELLQGIARTAALVDRLGGSRA